MKVINLFGGPGSGKSTLAAGLFYEMKKKGINCELVTEFAKEMVWDDNKKVLARQNKLLAIQEERLNMLEGKVDYAITDSPLLLGLFYAPKGYDRAFANFCFAEFKKYNNVNYFLSSVDLRYCKTGRIQNEVEAKTIGFSILTFLTSMEIPFETIDPLGEAIQTIMLDT